MSADEAGIIGVSGSAVPAPPEPPRAPTRWEAAGPALEEGAWLLGALAATALLVALLDALRGRFAAAAPGAALFTLHGLVGLHVLRTERRKLRGWLRLSPRFLALGLAGGAVLLAFNAGYGAAIEALGVTPPDVVQELAALAPMPVIVVWAGLFAPIVEELYFRGRLLDALDARVSPVWSGWITSLLFGAVHGIPKFFPAYVMLGLALVWLRRRTGGLAASALAHIVNNLVVLS